ncbi:MAG: hypothetical protein JSV26_12320 [bacterium]|nr:MAG: hypothetical protein JSV26_12320 [bacterium]
MSLRKRTFLAIPALALVLALGFSPGRAQGDPGDQGDKAPLQKPDTGPVPVNPAGTITNSPLTASNDTTPGNLSSEDAPDPSAKGKTPPWASIPLRDGRQAQAVRGADGNHLFLLEEGKRYLAPDGKYVLQSGQEITVSDGHILSPVQKIPPAVNSPQ